MLFSSAICLSFPPEVITSFFAGASNAWAKEENDRHFIDLVLALRGGELVPEAAQHRSACSSGAAAATLGAVTALGATKATLLEHATSAEVLGSKMPGDMADSVGYAGIVFS